MKNLVFTVAFVFFVAFGIAAGQNAPDCPVARSNDVSVLTDYLASHIHDLASRDCSVRVIRTLGKLKNPNSVRILVKYLDFRRPLSESEAKGFWIRTMSKEELFPAIESIFKIGRPAVAALIEQLGKESNEVRRENAIYALMLISRDDPPAAVASLRNAANRIVDKSAALRLMESARTAASLCVPEFRQKCEEMLR